MPSVAIGNEILGPHGEAYTILDFLGRGAFGEVFRAANRTGNVIAVKLLPLGGMADEVDRRALLNEMGAAQQVIHPNVVQLLHVNDGTNSDIGPYACMEYVTGGTLATFLRSNTQAGLPIPISRAIEMMIDIAQGTRAINAKLVHRDIKPDNILIEGKVLKIGDFGISKAIDDSTRLETFKGGQHVAYMAPEGWAGEKNTFKLDVYAVGLVFYQLVTDMHPLLLEKRPETVAAWRDAHLYQPCPDLIRLRPDTPLALSQLVARMVAKRPQERPTWDDVLAVLTDPLVDPGQPAQSAISVAVSSAVASAVLIREENEKQQLEANKKKEEIQRQYDLYKIACQGLLGKFQPSVDQFNREYQFGKIIMDGGSNSGFGTAALTPGVTVRLPMGKQIVVRFFEPRVTGFILRGKAIIGGGFIGLTRNISANLVLVKEGKDDLYGRWMICEVKIMALADVRKLIGRFGITKETVEPFGFDNSNDFYQQIYYACSGGMHAFTYEVKEDVEEYFARLIVEGCK